MAKEREANFRKICFILCVNDALYEEECVRYIRNLCVPQGYEVELIPVWGASSMASGYNKAMRQSDAKYKVYLHQDVFIVNRDFIKELLKLFENREIGMAGLVGSVQLPADGIMWSGERIGRIYSSNNIQAAEVDFGKVNAPYQEVEAVDGLLMATQYDVRWREDLFAGWDFYDISQAMEMRRRGYRVVVPHMEHSWVLHDDGASNLDAYFDWRDVFLREYGEMLHE